jgi:hypothetical protein
MANTYKNIVVTPNIGSATDDPKIVFSGANTSTNTDITLRVYPTSNGTLSFEGSAGQLFSITNQLTGTLFSVNDVSGIPSIEVLDTGLVKLAQYNGNVGIGTANASYKLDVNGTARISGNLVFSNTTSNGITFADGSRQTIAYNPNIDTTQNTNISATNGKMESAYTQANTAITNVSATNGKMESAYTQANTAITNVSATNGKMESAYNKANTSAGGVTSITGTTNQITANVAIGNVLLALPQSIATTSSVQFGSFGVGTAASGTSGEIRAINNITSFYSSDRKFKENIETIPNALDSVDAIGGNLFDWTDAYLEAHGGENDYFLRKEDFGVIAQDVQAVFPRAIRTRPDGSLAVDYEKLVALAFAAIRELNRGNGVLVESIKELSQKVKDLESK